jgi:hypothetical protein
MRPPLEEWAGNSANLFGPSSVSICAVGEFRAARYGSRRERSCLAEFWADRDRPLGWTTIIRIRLEPCWSEAWKNTLAAALCLVTDNLADTPYSGSRPVQAAVGGAHSC